MGRFQPHRLTDRLAAPLQPLRPRPALQPRAPGAREGGSRGAADTLCTPHSAQRAAEGGPENLVCSMGSGSSRGSGGARARLAGRSSRLAQVSRWGTGAAGPPGPGVSARPRCLPLSGPQLDCGIPYWNPVHRGFGGSEARARISIYVAVTAGSVDNCKQLLAQTRVPLLCLRGPRS